MSLTSHADISRRSILAAAAAGATVAAVKIPNFRGTSADIQ